MPAKPTATLSLDLDNQWAYMKTHGDAGWESYPSYLETVLPRILDMLARCELRITFFVVGQDAAIETHRSLLRHISTQGHEIASHSFHHDPQLCLLSEEQIDGELAQAEAIIESATGRRPLGFRGPGFSQSSRLLNVLARRGYQYDASVLPSFLGPLGRCYYFLTGRFAHEDKRRLRALYGSAFDGLRPLEPFQWETAYGRILELPVSTVPVIRAPFHLTYVHFLGARMGWAARTYFRAALDLCRAARIPPSILLHPTDFLGIEDTDALAFFPGMRMPRTVKLARTETWLNDLTARFEVSPLGEFASRIAADGTLLKRLVPRFSGRDGEADAV